MPAPLQLRTAVADVVNENIIITSGFRIQTAVEDPVVYTSEGNVVVIIGVGVSTALGEAGVGTVDGGIENVVPISGVEASADVGEITSPNIGGGWRNPAGKYPRGRWRKPKDEEDAYYEQGVEFLPLISEEDTYGPWWRVSTVTNDSVILRSIEAISSDYSIEGRP